MDESPALPESYPRNYTYSSWMQHQRRISKCTPSFSCVYCPDRKIFIDSDELWLHAQEAHSDKVPTGEIEVETARSEYESRSALKRTIKEEVSQKRPLSTPLPTYHSRSIDVLKALNLQKCDDPPTTGLGDASRRKRAAIGDGISAGSASRLPRLSEPPPPRRARAPSSSTPGLYEVREPRVEVRSLWPVDQETLPSRASLEPSNVSSVQIQTPRYQTLQKQPEVPTQQRSHCSAPFASYSRHSPSNQTQATEVSFDIVLQPETRPISQEQLVAEVKGIYAGLVMVEAKCIEVDNKQATLASADPGAQPKLNNEQWQALIALHRTLVHEHHDFFLGSQHPSTSPVLRGLASKYAMPARMWRHGNHSFLELLRHRLPASMDHMLSFIYLAYSMMALLYETVPAFVATWIQCLGDLGWYRMAIEDDDIRDREVWTGVARHWYSKASDKVPTTSRLYHHLAILARPNALHQLFYYSKSLWVAVPFTSAKESILTLFDPVLNYENSQEDYRLPPLHRYLKVSGKAIVAGRLYHYFAILARPNSSQQLSYHSNALCVPIHFASAQEPVGTVLKTVLSTDRGQYKPHGHSLFNNGNIRYEVSLTNAASAHYGKGPLKESLTDTTSSQASRLHNFTLEIALRRIGSPNIVPFIRTALSCMCLMRTFPGAIEMLGTNFPLESLVYFFNTLLVSGGSQGANENMATFLFAEDDEARPLPEDFAPHGVLWPEESYPADWFDFGESGSYEKLPKYQSIFAQREATRRKNTLGPYQEVGGSLTLPDTISAWKTTATTGLSAVISLFTKLLRSISAFGPVVKILLLFQTITFASALPTNTASQNADVDGTIGQAGSPASATDDLAWTLFQWLSLLLSYIAILWNDTIESQRVYDIEAGRAVNTRTSSLLFFTSVAAVATFTLGYDGTLPNLALAGYWLTSAGLSWEYIRRKLAPLEKTAGPTAFTIAVLDMALTEAIVRLSSPWEGRYSDTMILRLCTLLPVAMFIEWAYVACLLSWAQRFEISITRPSDGSQPNVVIQGERSRLRDPRSNSRGRQGTRRGHS